MSGKTKVPVDCETYSIKEAGKVLGVGGNKAYQLVREKKIPVIDLSGVLRVPKGLLRKMLENPDA